EQEAHGGGRGGWGRKDTTLARPCRAGITRHGLRIPRYLTAGPPPPPLMKKFFDFLTGARPPLVDQSLDDMGAMLDTAAEMFAAATAYLLDNAPLVLDLSAPGEAAHARGQKARRAVLEHVTINPRDELALSLLILSVVQDAERCGDLAKSIAKAADLADAPRGGRHAEALRAIRDRVQALFPQARQAFLSADTQQ